MSTLENAHAMKNIGYHTRLDANNATKVCGGSFGGGFDLDTANRLVSAHFTVVVRDSGRAVFVDREGREVSLYVTVDPAVTAKGKEAIAQWNIAQRQKQAVDEERARQHQEVIESLMSNLTHEEIIKRLKGESA